ncbi:MAG TPA: SDR family NAD(P)-dependent oxidoreductase [Trebonia sp.]
MSDQLQGQVALVTGASRGIGKGIALELGAAGATVYVTSRSGRADGTLPGSIGETADEISELGGTGIGIVCDHLHDEEVRAVLARIDRDQGRLDVLVNNVYSSPALAPWLGKPFWELPLEAWDQIFDIGVRSHYVASALSAPIMIRHRRGLIVNVSSPGADHYMHNVVYGVGKSALDRMTADMSHELADVGVAVVSVWPGITRTEFTGRAPRDDLGRQMLTLPGEGQVDLDNAETPRFSGRGVVALASDPSVARHSGKALRIRHLAELYKFTDIDGRVPSLDRSVRAIPGTYEGPTPNSLLRNPEGRDERS